MIGGAGTRIFVAGAYGCGRISYAERSENSASHFACEIALIISYIRERERERERERRRRRKRERESVCERERKKKKRKRERERRIATTMRMRMTQMYHVYFYAQKKNNYYHS